MRARLNTTFVKTDGTPVTAGLARVNLRGTATAATLYTTETGSTLASNPLTVTNSRVDAWADEGSYDVVVTGAFDTYTFSWESVKGAASAHDRTFNVRDYGAKGDNSTNDTAAIQAAIDAAGTGGMVYFPTGTYLCANAITLHDYMTLQGSGYGSTIVYSGSTALATLTGTLGVKFISLRFTLSAASSSVFKLSGAFLNSWQGCWIAGTHTAGTPTHGQIGVQLRDNSGDNFFVDTHFNNLGEGIQTSSIQNYLEGCIFGTCWRSIHGDDASVDSNGLSLNNVTMTSSASATETHILIDGSGNTWWLNNVWLEGCGTGIQVGNTANTKGPFSFYFVNGQVAATTKCIEFRVAQQGCLQNIGLFQDPLQTPTALTFPNPASALNGFAANIFGSAVPGGYELVPQIFPARWRYDGRTYSRFPNQIVDDLNVLGNGTFKPPDSTASVPLTAELPNGSTAADAFQVKNNGSIMARFDPFYALHVGGAINAGAYYAYDNTFVAASAPNRSVFVDTADGILKFKDGSGTLHALY